MFNQWWMRLVYRRLTKWTAVRFKLKSRENFKVPCDGVNKLGQLFRKHPVWNLCGTFAVVSHQTANWRQVVWVCLLLQRFCASLCNISIYPVNCNAGTPAGCKEKTKIFVVALRRLLFTSAKREVAAESSGRPACHNSSNSPSPLASLSPRSTLKLHFIIEVDGSYVGMDTLRSLWPPPEETCVAFFFFCVGVVLWSRIWRV